MMRDNKRPTEDKGIVPLPLVIGVTGHRDLREEDRKPLETQVCEILADLQRRYPSTPLLLLSPLAEGADRLVARVALEKGVRLIVPLPMPRALYEQDFQTRASRDEFNEMLQHAEWWFELPLLEGVREEDARQQGPVRDRQYAQVGAYIALHSQILIALWDGIYTDQVGGTSQVVQFELQGTPQPYAPPRNPLDEPESGQVYHVVTPRLKTPTPVGRPFELHKLPPLSSTHQSTYFEKSIDVAEQRFDRILQGLDTFNRDGISLGTRLLEKKEQSMAALLGDLDTTTLLPAHKQTLDRYAQLYATADTLAIYFRDRTVKTLFFLFSLFFISVVFFDVFAHFTFLGEWLRSFFLFLYLVFLFIAYYIWYYRATKGNYKNKYLDYRALAEGLRVQFCWRLAGLPDTVATHYLRKQKSELDWIRNSIRVANLLCDASSGKWLTDSSVSTSNDYYHLILKPWVYDQSRYFTLATRRDHERQKTNEWWVRSFFLLGVVLASLLLLLQLFLPESVWINLLIVFMSFALVLAALREGYADKMAYAELAKQYQRMSQLFLLASQLLKDFLEQGNFLEAEYVIHALGEEALAENGDWVILHRSRPINVPMRG